jgi:hypothetical protein
LQQSPRSSHDADPPSEPQLRQRYSSHILLTRSLPRRPDPATGPRVYWMVTAVLLSATVAAVAAGHPSLYRLMFAVTFALALITVGVMRPGAGAILTLLFLCFSAFIRRLLIGSAGWSGSDPLLLVGPLAVGALLLRTYLIEGREFSKDTLVRVVYALLALMLLQVLNPSGAGIGAALSGLLFLAVPLLWFLAGRELADRQIILIAAYGVVGVGVITAIYGLAQTQVGFPVWDQNWISVTNIASLNIGQGQLRGFGTLSNSAEYKQIVAMAAMAVLALGLHGRPTTLLAMPLLLTGLVLSGARSAIVLTLLGVILVTAVRLRSGRLAIGAAVLAIALSLVALGTLSNSLERVASNSSNAAVARQANGLSNPLDATKSTLPGHISLVINGFVSGITYPVGRGTGAANLAGSRAGAVGSTEVDFTDVLISLGILGFAMYVFVVASLLKRIVSEYRRRPDVLLLVVFGFLMVSFMAWLKGAHYAATSILWFFAGWASTQTTSKDAVRETTLVHNSAGSAARTRR